MIKQVVDRSNSLILATSFFDATYGLCEQKQYNSNEAIAIWDGTKFITIKHNIDPSFVYWRKTGDISTSVIDDQFISGKVAYDISIPLRLVAILNRTETPENDEYSPDRMALYLIKLCTFRGKNHGIDIPARKIQMSSTDYSTDTENILDEEMPNLKLKDYKKIKSVISIDFELEVVIRAECIDSVLNPSGCNEVIFEGELVTYNGEQICWPT